MHWTNLILVLLFGSTAVALLVEPASRELARVRRSERGELFQKLGVRAEPRDSQAGLHRPVARRGGSTGVR